MISESESTSSIEMSAGTEMGAGASSAASNRSWTPAAVALWVLVALGVGSIAVVSAIGIAAWRWTDQHLPVAGMQSSITTSVDRTELLRQVQAFQLVTTKQTYAAQTHQRLDQTFTAGANHVALPAWFAGEQMRVQGEAHVTAGVDLAKVTPEDIQVSRNGTAMHVQIHVPAASVISTELAPNTLKISTSTGVLTQLGQSLGVSQERLRDRAADELLQSARVTAEQQGIQAVAGHEAQVRLERFLQQLPQNGGHVTYTIVVG